MRAIATVCLSGDLRTKLEAIARAGFDGVEIFENDLLSFNLFAILRRCRNLSAAAISSVQSENSS